MLPAPVLPPRSVARLVLGASLLLATSASALTTYQLGIAVQAGYNSQVLTPIRTMAAAGQMGSDLYGGGAATLSVSPFVELAGDSGRISERFRYQLHLDGILLVQTATPTYSYQNTINSATRIDLTPRLVWTLGVVGSQGQINSFSQSQDASTRVIEGMNLIATSATNFISAGGTSLLDWQPTARWKITQPLAFRAFIPYGSLDTTTGTGTTMQNATTSFQSYSLDGGVGLDHLWARYTLGGELRFGWFLPQGGTANQAVPDSRSLVTGQLIARLSAILTPRLRGEAHAGVFVATLASNFFQGTVQTVDPTTGALITGRGTLVSPIGAVLLGYDLPPLRGVQAGVSLNYLHGAAGEVFIGALTLSDSVTLRVNVPLPRGVGVGGSAGYRYARITGIDGFSTTRINPDTMMEEALGQSYHVAQTDAIVSWRVRDGVSLFARYEYIHQEPSGTPGPEGALLPFDRHLGFAGVALVYPPK